MPHYRKLVGERVYLSPISPEDAEFHARWENDLVVTIPLGDEAYTPITAEEERESIEHCMRNHEHIFTILLKDGDVPIGRCLLFHMNSVDRFAEVGIAIGERDRWGQGYGTEALRLLADYAFNLLNLRSLRLGVFSFNERAMRCYRKVGFKEIGRWRQTRTIAGVSYDEVLMDLLATEFGPSALIGDITP